MKKRERKDLKRFNARYRRGSHAPQVGTPDQAEPTVVRLTLSYVLCMPALVGLAILFFYSAFFAAAVSPTAGAGWLVFICAGISAAIFWIQTRLTRLRTMIHEFKHAVMVMFTGGKVDKIEVGDDGGGSIEYSHYDEGARYQSIIALAPYYFPLLSFPVMLACLVSTPDMHAYYAAALGAAFATDIISGVADIGPHQTDIENIFGRFYLAGFFIAAADLAWFSVLAVWVSGGTKGFLFLWRIAAGMFAP